MSEHGHRYEFGAPRGGWPRFGPDGMRIRDDEDDAPDDARCPACGASLGAAPASGADGDAVHSCEAGGHAEDPPGGR